MLFKIWRRWESKPCRSRGKSILDRSHASGKLLRGNWRALAWDVKGVYHFSYHFRKAALGLVKFWNLSLFYLLTCLTSLFIFCLFSPWVYLPWVHFSLISSLYKMWKQRPLVLNIFSSNNVKVWFFLCTVLAAFHRYFCVLLLLSLS